MLNKVDVECSQLVIECNKSASIKHACNHEVSWLCGTDEDPREQRVNCKICIFDDWDSVIKNEVSVEQNQQLMEKIETKIYNL